MPAAALRVLAAGAASEGSDPGRVLREAGRRTGAALFREIGGESAARKLPPGAFLQSLNRILRDRGLGSVGYRVLEPGVAELSLEGSPEVSPDGPPGCVFAVGWIGDLLARLADARLAVMEVRCRGTADGAACRFLVGSPERLARLDPRPEGRAGPADVRERPEERRDTAREGE